MSHFLSSCVTLKNLKFIELYLLNFLSKLEVPTPFDGLLLVAVVQSGQAIVTFLPWHGMLVLSGLKQCCSLHKLSKSTPKKVARCKGYDTTRTRIEFVSYFT